MWDWGIPHANACDESYWKWKNCWILVRFLWILSLGQIHRARQISLPTRTHPTEWKWQLRKVWSQFYGPFQVFHRIKTSLGESQWLRSILFVSPSSLQLPSPQQVELKPRQAGLNGTPNFSTNFHQPNFHWLHKMVILVRAIVWRRGGEEVIIIVITPFRTCCL